MLRKYFIIILFIAIFASCNSEKESVETQQIIDIEEYLSTQEIVYENINGVYRSFRTVALESDSGGDTSTEVLTLEPGDSIYIKYVAYIFNSAPAAIFDTNVESIALQLGFTAADKSFAPLEIEYGVTPLIRGLEYGLSGLEEGDMISLFMPFNLAYGEKEIGVLPAESAINFEIDVIRIKKR